jgi:hypothetical protein
MLLWKSILFHFGDADMLKKTKEYTRKLCKMTIVGDDIVRSIPSDYEQFRGEVFSKYPSHHDASTSTTISDQEKKKLRSSVHTLPDLENLQFENDGLLLPTHIATPAPSPPPSPKIKRGIYQTDQSFPFMFPPSSKSKLPVSVDEAEKIFLKNTFMSVPALQHETLFRQYRENAERTPIPNEASAGIHMLQLLESEREDRPIMAEILSRVATTYVLAVTMNNIS